MIILLLVQYFEKQIIKAFIISIIVIPSIVFIAYNSSILFKNRVHLAYDQVVNYEDNKNTSVGLRLTFALNSWKIIKENPLIGVGTGDFKNEYEKVNTINTPQLQPATNPHNMYTLELVQFGILGLLSLFFIAFNQVKFSLQSKDPLVHKLGITLPLLFGVIMFSDSYLLGHYTTLLFILFSAILYKDWDCETN